jgi:hypothetical protein
MFNDSNSPHSDLLSLQAWLKQPLTQEALLHLGEAADSLSRLVMDNIPDSILHTNLREQSIGEVRGLRLLHKVCQDRLLELQRKVDEDLKRAKDESVPQMDESSEPNPFASNS